MTRNAAAAALLGLIASGLASFQSAQEPDLTLSLDGDEYVLELHSKQASVLEFLERVGEELDSPIRFNKPRAASESILVKSLTRIPRAELRAFMDAVVTEAGFFVLESSWGSGSYLEVVYPSGREFPKSEIMAKARQVDLADIDKWRTRQTMISVVIPLEHTDGRLMMSTVNPLLDIRTSSVRTVPPNNSLLLITKADIACHIVDLMRKLDVPGLAAGPVRQYELDVAQLKEQVADLTREVDQLKARLDVLDER